MSKVSVTKTKLDYLANCISSKSGETCPLTLDEMADAVLEIQTGGTPRTSTDLVVNGATVTAPAGVYATDASKSVASGTAGTAGQYGVYGYSISNAGVVTIRKRYNSNYSLTVNGTFTVEVHKLTYPTGSGPVFDM